MENSNESVGQMSLKKEAIAQGYGTFPYVIVRIHSAIYLQVPIKEVQRHEEKYPGEQVTTPEQGETYLLELTKRYKEAIDLRNNTNHRLCLVLGPEQGFFYEGSEIRPNTSIPSGGTLLNVQQQVIAMNVKHYIQTYHL